MINKKIKVLIVEDSILFVTILKEILVKNNQFEICGIVKNGLAATEFVSKMRPDVITMDINMPVMNGYDATREIMSTNPTPIIILSANIDETDINDTFKALEAGAVAIIEKPSACDSPDFHLYEKRLVQLVRLMSEVKVVRRIDYKNRKREYISRSFFSDTEISNNIEVIGIGASTGGPVVIEKILAGLPKDFSFPIVIVQHISRGFTKGLVEWLNRSSAIPVKLAENNETITKGVCYVAPDDAHLGIIKNTLMLSDSKPLYNMRPSVGFLFASLANNYGNKALGILLTGMGRDGSEELKTLRDTGAITIAQDKESSVIFGMPGEAIKLNGASFIYTPDKIINFLEGLNTTKNK